MTFVKFEASKWLENTLEDIDDARTLVQLFIAVDKIVITRNYNRRSGAGSDTINVPLLPLVQRIADSWWPLLYEPYRANVVGGFAVRHRLDGAMHGYAFPPLALCSGGRDTLYAAWGQQRPEEHTRIEFLAAPAFAPDLRRDQTELSLIELVEMTIERLSYTANGRDELTSAWARIQHSMSDGDELAYCRIAGRLGLDPYDAASPDITGLGANMGPALFEDISDAAFVEELKDTTDWVRSVQEDLATAPTVDLTLFGEPSFDDLTQPAWKMGASSAQALRETLNISEAKPRSELDRVLGEVLLQRSAFRKTGPPSINVLVKREDGLARIGAISRSAREQRFRACTGTYIAWLGQVGDERAATPAVTRRQQASRAFAAELLAPQSYLREIAPAQGLTSDQIEAIAGKLVCPHETVAWQARNAGISLRGESDMRGQQPLLI